MARSGFGGIRADPLQIPAAFTTRFVLAECGNALARTEFRGVIAEIERALRRTGGLIDITAADWSAALDRYTAGFPNGASLVDEISFHAMQPRGIRRAFTNDRHLVAAGFEILF